VPFGAATADDAFSTRGLLARLSATSAAFDDVHAAAQAAQHSDALRQAFAAFGADLGDFLRPFVEQFGAHAVVALGGIANAWPLFAPALQAHLPVPALRGALGAHAALIGAADLLGA
jgi:glucokinase